MSVRGQAVRTATCGIGRGVWVAPWTGPNGETILVAVRRDSRTCGWRLLAAGDDHAGASDELWETLEREDAQPILKVI